MRLFIGLGLPAGARVALDAAVKPLRLHTEAVWVPAELYHITLAFLGEREKKELAVLEAVLRDTASFVAGFSVTVTGFGTFGRTDNAILYAAAADCPALTALSTTLRTRLTEAGQAFDSKPFTPHITLARKAKLPAVMPPQPFAPISFAAHQATLYHSTRVNGVLRYLPVFSIPLNGLFGEADR